MPTALARAALVAAMTLMPQLASARSQQHTIDSYPAGTIIAPVHIDHSCVIGAAAYYGVPPELIIGIRMQEGGRVGAIAWNKNGTYDIGPMQINSSHLREFAQYGVTYSYLLQSECTNIYAGAWILYREMQASPHDIWRAIGNYNSAVPYYHYRYRAEMNGRMRVLYTAYKPYVDWLRDEAITMRAKLYGSTGQRAQPGAAEDPMGTKAAYGGPKGTIEVSQ